MDMADILSYDEFIKLSKSEQSDCLYAFFIKNLQDKDIKFSERSVDRNKEIRIIDLSGRLYEEHCCYVYGKIFFNVNKNDSDTSGEDILLQCFTPDYLDKTVKEQAKAFTDSWNASHKDLKLIYSDSGYSYYAEQVFSLASISKDELSYNDFIQNINFKMIHEPVLLAGKVLEEMCFEYHFLISWDNLLQKRDRYGIMEYFEIKGNRFIKRYDIDTDVLEIKMSFHSDKVSHPIFIYLSNGSVRFQIHYKDTQVFEKIIPEDEEAAEVIEEIANSL